MQNKQPSKPLLFYNSSSQSPKSSSPFPSHQHNSGTVCQTSTHLTTQNGKNMVIASPLQVTCDLSANVGTSGTADELSQLQQMNLIGSQQTTNGTQNANKYEVYMRCVTWGRDSHGLFDYESRQIAKRNIKSYTGGKIIRLNNDVEFISKQSSAAEYGPTAKPLIIVHEKNGKFMVENDTLVAFSQEDAQIVPQDEDVNNKMFIVVRNLKTTAAKSDYRLKKGDIIKLGRIKFKVKDFRTDLVGANLDLNNKRQSYSPVKKSHTLQQDDDYWIGGDDFSEEAIEIDCGVVDSTQNDIQCKVCWSNEQSPQNPLLNSCKCDGSVRFIHYECLKYWLKQKMQKKEESNLISYSWKQFECEICKKPYPYVFKSNGKKYRLVDVELPEDKKFLWLESLTFEKNSSRMVHLIIPDQEMNIFKLGRGHESDVRVSDISVSRCHAILKYDDTDHNYYLEDNLSKFGTLVLAKQAIELEVNQTQAVQIGRSVISFTVKPISHSTTQIKNPSPHRVGYQQPQLQSSSSQNQTVEELLRIKIEETNQKINRIMHANSNSSAIQNAQMLLSNDAVISQEQTDFSVYLQALQSQQDQQMQIQQQQLLRIQQDSQQQQQSQQHLHQCNDPRCQYNIHDYNQEERDKLNHTLQRFEKMIQNVEQRLADRDNRYSNVGRSDNQTAYHSPPRNRDNNYQRVQSNNQESPNGEVDEAILRTQYKHNVNHNEWKYRQLLSNLNNPDFYQESNSPLLSSNSNFISADKPSISFHQLKSKYGNALPNYPNIPSSGTAIHGPQQLNVSSNYIQRGNNIEKYEDMKDGEGDYFHVPEENEEEPPLRLRSSQFESDHSPIRIEKIDLQKYLQSNQQLQQNSNGNQYPQFNRNVNLNSKSNTQNEDKYYGGNLPNQESALFSQIENKDFSRQEIGDISKSQMVLSNSPSKHDFSKKAYIDLQNQQTLSSQTGMNNQHLHNQSSLYTNNNMNQKSNHKLLTQGSSKQQHQQRSNQPARLLSTEKKDHQNLKNSVNKYGGVSGANDHAHHPHSRFYQQQQSSTSNKYKRTSSQSPWRVMSDDNTPTQQLQSQIADSQQHTIVTPIKQSTTVHQQRRATEQHLSYHQKLGSGGMYNNINGLSGNKTSGGQGRTAGATAVTQSLYAKNVTSSPQKQQQYYQNSHHVTSSQPSSHQYTPGKVSRGKKDSSIGRGNLVGGKTSTNYGGFK